MPIPVTDLMLLKELAREYVDSATVDFDQDYAVHAAGKRQSPYAKFYRSLEKPGLNWMVVSGLPMVDGSGDPLTPGWQFVGPHFVAKKNLYSARIQGRDVELTVRNDDAIGRKQGWTLAYSPRLFVGGLEVPAVAPVLLLVDPWNPAYQNNVLEWDYGICKRKLRTVEGRVHGYWVFPANPGGDVLIRYGQVGDYRLKLGQYHQNEDEEFIPASVFAFASYPFEVSDSATYNPDANPETTSVDGYVLRYVAAGEAWADIIAGTGTNANDTATTIRAVYIEAGTTTDLFKFNDRGIILFDTSALPDGAVISAATLSLYGQSKADALVAIPNMNIYASTPASNTALAAADYGQTGATAFATAITYAGWATDAYNDFALNASGIAAISLTGVSKFSTKNVNYDVDAVQPPWVSAGLSHLRSWAAEQGAGYKPKLVVTYTSGAALNLERIERHWPRGVLRGSLRGVA